MKVRKWPVVGVLLAVLWVFVRGAPLTPADLASSFLSGLVVGLGVAFTFRRLYLPTVDVGHAVQGVFAGTLYLLLFLKEIIAANLDVAYRVLHPSMPIEPDVVAIQLRVQHDAAITSLANSITLTPGTLTMDHDPETNTLYVHGIIGRRREAVVGPIRRWEDLLLVVFDEEMDPEDEPPAPEGVREPATADDAGSSPDELRRGSARPGGEDDGR